MRKGLKCCLHKSAIILQLVIAALVFNACIDGSSDISQGDDSREIAVFNSDESAAGAWTSEQLATQKLDGKDAVSARMYKKGDVQFTVEIVDTNVAPDLVNAFPKTQTPNSEEVVWENEAATLYKFMERASYVLVQHKGDGRIYRITGLGFRNSKDFLKAIEGASI